MDKLSYQDVNREILRTLSRPPRSYYLIVGALFLGILWAAICWYYQIVTGLGVTGLLHPSMWILYLVNFVFFIGISHAGTLISAILRITKAEWRRPITRAAELITVIVLFFGVAERPYFITLKPLAFKVTKNLILIFATCSA